MIAPDNGALGGAGAERIRYTTAELERDVAEIAGDKGRAIVVVDDDPAAAIVRAAADNAVDVVVVGNAGMSGRKKFLLANIPNRVSHTATCTVVIVNSTQGTEPEPSRAPAITVLADDSGTDDVLLTGRAAEIGRVLAKYGLDELRAARADADDKPEDRARRLRLAFEELGPTFCKLGQILSTRPDLMSAPFVEELATLRDRVPPLTEEEIVQAMERELRVPWEDVFDSIDGVPLAAGSIAQVHRAVLSDGSKVVVKVQRPSARNDMLRDLGLLELFAQKSAKRPGVNQLVDIASMVEHLSESLQRELDFELEAASMQRMRDVLSAYSRLGVPEVHTDLSTKRLLVMEEIEGVPISDAPLGEARQEAARQLIESYYTQVLGEGYFHADPHPGNLMWWNDRVYFLDFGMVGEVGPKLREDLTLLLLAFWREDEAFLTDITLTLGGDHQPEDLDIDHLRAELGQVMVRYRNVPLREMQLGPILQEMTEISMRHGIRLPASLLLTAKAFAQVQIATTELDPDLDPFAVAGRYMARTTLHRVRESLDPQMLVYEAQKIRVRLVHLIEAVERVTGARPGPKLQIQFRGMEGLETNLRRAGRRLSIALAVAGTSVATAITAASDDVPDWVPKAFGAASAALTAGLVADVARRDR